MKEEDFSATAAIQNSGEFTFIQVNYTYRDNDTAKQELPDRYISYERAYTFRLEFSSKTGAWEDGLGYQANRVYRHFPCKIRGSIVASNDNVACDLHTKREGKQNPYLEIYGFRTSALVSG